MTSFVKALHALIEKEGGYSNHAADRGGPTNWGITEAVARAFGYQGDMQLMSKDTAFAIYRERYWRQPKFDEVSLLDADIADELFDTGVNMGPSVAGRFLQRALNVLNQQGRTYPDLTVDGSIGRLTLYALKAFLTSRGKDGKTVLLRLLNAQQGCRYMEIAENNPSQEVFMYGWTLNRVT